MTTRLKTLTITLVTFLLLLTQVALPNMAQAQQCERDGQCVNNQRCRCLVWNGDACVSWAMSGACGSAVIGGVSMPEGVKDFQIQNGTAAQIGILNFVSNILVLISIIAGLFVMFNFIRAGWMFLVAGDNTKAAGEVKDLLTYSVIGLVIIAVAYTIAGLIGLLFFGDAGFILNPQLESAITQ